MFVYKSRFLTRGEVWFDDQPDGSRVDWIYHRQRSTPLANCRSKPFYTVLVDLQKSPADLFAAMEAKTARKITEARDKDKLRCERCDSRDASIIVETNEMWNRFAVAQKNQPLDRAWVEQFLEAGALDVVAARDADGMALVYHLVLLTPKRARQLIAISPHQAVPSIAWRNAVSRANCLVHWHNFQAFKAQGIEHFDFGGWYPGSTDIQLLGLNTFKKSFGGYVAREFDCELPVTNKGRVALMTARILARLRSARLRSPAERPRQHNATRPQDHKVSPAFR